MDRILVVDQDPASRRQLRETLADGGFSVAETESLADVGRGDIGDVAAIVAGTAGALVPGGRLPPLAGTPVVVVAGDASISGAVASIRAGAADYIPRPSVPAALVQAVGAAVADGASDRTPDDAAAEAAMPPMIGNCPAMRDLFDRIGKVAPTDSTVLIQGESGTGKELVARALHARSGRRGEPMVSLNCAAIPEPLIESELFGQSSGAPGGDAPGGLIEAAHGGTLFLDEIGELPRDAQARLLRVLQDGEIRRIGATSTRRVDIRLIAATHLDIEALTHEGRFRDDLYYRLAVVSLHLPPLRARGDDVIALAQALLATATETLNKPGLVFSDAAREAIRRYRWPGNVRELANAVERAVILCDGASIEPDLLAIDPRTGADGVHEAADGADSLTDYFVRFVLDHEDQYTETELANRLGISRKSLWERRQRLNIPRRRTRKRGPRTN